MSSDFDCEHCIVEHRIIPHVFSATYQTSIQNEFLFVVAHKARMHHVEHATIAFADHWKGVGAKSVAVRLNVPFPA